MKYQFADYQESADALKGILYGFRPKALLILGGGLECMLDTIEDSNIIPFSAIPHMEGRAGRGLVFGLLGGCQVIAMQAAPMYYDCLSMEETAYPVRVAWLAGVQTLIQMNSAGAVNSDYRPGDIMLVADHIALPLESPLSGGNLSEFGPRHPDVTGMYSESLLERARKAGVDGGLSFQCGTLLFTPGPQYETPAEARAARILGADAVCMAIVPQAIAAAHCSMDSLALVLLTNMGAGMSEQPLFESDVVAACLASQPKIHQFFGTLLSGLA
jgi:purine-nucleoside phosphorylase